MGETGCLYIAFFLAQPSLASSLTLLWTITRFLDPFYTFSPAHHRVIRDFTPPKPFECVGIQFFNSHTCDLRDAMPRQRSLTHTHVTCGMPCHARGHLLHPTLYLEKWRISPGVIGILSVYLRLHT